ncbi:hypothetical protein ACJX0J_028519, partial [Zea mays]
MPPYYKWALWLKAILQIFIKSRKKEINPHVFTYFLLYCSLVLPLIVLPPSYCIMFSFNILIVQILYIYIKRDRERLRTNVCGLRIALKFEK